MNLLRHLKARWPWLFLYFLVYWIAVLASSELFEYFGISRELRVPLAGVLGFVAMVLFWGAEAWYIETRKPK